MTYTLEQRERVLIKFDLSAQDKCQLVPSILYSVTNFEIKNII